MRNHYTRFFDYKRWPGYAFSDEQFALFAKQQTFGNHSLSPEELQSIEPLIDAQKRREITIRTLYEECADWWSNGWGWIYPIRDMLCREFNSRHEHKDRVFIKILIKIYRRFLSQGFMESLIAFSGIPQQQKNKYLDRYANLN